MFYISLPVRPITLESPPNRDFPSSTGAYAQPYTAYPVYTLFPTTTAAVHFDSNKTYKCLPHAHAAITTFVRDSSSSTAPSHPRSVSHKLPDLTSPRRNPPNLPISRPISSGGGHKLNLRALRHRNPSPAFYSPGTFRPSLGSRPAADLRERARPLLLRVGAGWPFVPL